ncbi:MAG: dockerin type I repeat-containing protein [Oscillospiraceae bacterium]|nr:dockerin type I repeat-containing protein [Oscillospiraceae bacterium]
MKHTQKIFAALAAGAVMLGSLSVLPADALSYLGMGHYSGVLPESALIDDKGMFRSSGVSSTNYRVYVPVHSNNLFMLVFPHETELSFTLRKGLDEEAAEEQALAIIQKYIPETVFGRADDASTCLYGQTYVNQEGEKSYTLFAESEAVRTAETADSIKRELAAAGLISAFYTWGKSAAYNNSQYFSWSVSPYTEYDDTTHTGTPRDLTPLQSLLEQQHPGWKLETYTETVDFPDGAGGNTSYPLLQCKAGRDGEVPLEEYIRVGADLYEAFPETVSIWATFPQFGWDTGYLVIGENALAADMDVNLDCSVDVADAVLLARYINSDSEAAVCEQGIRNASADGSTQVTTDDITRILMKIAKKI